MEKFFEWLAQPFVDIHDTMRDRDIANYEVISQPPPVEFQTVEQKNKLFRPATFDDYIGQDRAKNMLKDYIRAIQNRERVFPHTIISGKAGCGKTTLAKIIANMLGLPFTELITSEIVTAQDLLLQVSVSGGGILFLDEIHSIERGVAESIYTIMEDFTYEGADIQPFTLIGATTELGEIIRTRRPFYDRFKLPIELEDYTDEELTKIATQYKNKTFPEDEVSEDIFNIIGKNSRSTPRTSLRLLEACVYLDNNIERVLDNFGIIKDGYTHRDLKTLEYIKRNEKGVGLQGLATYLGTSPDNYTYEIEPYLLKSDLIIRTPRGRKVTEEGIAKIEELRGECV